MRTSLLNRGGMPKCMIQFSRAPIRRFTSASCNACVRAAPTDSGCVSSMTPLPIGEARNGNPVFSMKADFVLGARPRHTFADDHQRTLRGLQHVQRLLDVLLRRGAARWLGTARGEMDFLFVGLALDDVVRHVEISGAGSSVDGIAHRHLDVERDANRMLHSVRELAEGRRDQHLALFLDPPMPLCRTSDAPPIRMIGQQFSFAFARPERPCTTPGPDTTRHAPGRPVR